MGTIAQSWELVKQSFAVLRGDKELMLLPVFSGVFCTLTSVIIAGGGALIFMPDPGMFAAGARHQPITQGMWICLFVLYVANYFVMMYFQVALVSAAGDRLAGGHATANDALQLAWTRRGKILQWALLAATVGVLLRMLRDRADWVGRLAIGFVGMAWQLATIFVVPVLAAENVGPGEALQRSADLFRQTWGEEVTGSFSFGLIFILLSVPAIAFPFLFVKFLGPGGLLAGLVLAVLYWLVLGVVGAAVKGIFIAALYRYATRKQVVGGFRLQDFFMAWQPRH